MKGKIEDVINIINKFEEEVWWYGCELWINKAQAKVFEDEIKKTMFWSAISFGEWMKLMWRDVVLKDDWWFWYALFGKYDPSKEIMMLIPIEAKNLFNYNNHE